MMKKWDKTFQFVIKVSENILKLTHVASTQV